MSLLFHGTYGRHKKPKLFGTKMQVIEVPKLFKHFLPDATGRLAPRRLRNVARVWWFVKHNTTAVSWRDELGVEQTIFLNGLHEPDVATPLARIEFPEVMPSPIVFRKKRKVKKK